MNTKELKRFQEIQEYFFLRIEDNKKFKKMQNCSKEFEMNLRE